MKCHIFLCNSVRYCHTSPAIVLAFNGDNVVGVYNPVIHPRVLQNMYLPFVPPCVICYLQVFSCVLFVIYVTYKYINVIRVCGLQIQSSTM